MLWKENRRATSLGIAAITVFPVLLSLLAWDTSRVAGFGFLGMLWAIVFLLQNWRSLPRNHSLALLTVLCVNIAFPSYNVIIEYADSISNYSHPGLYRVIHSLVHFAGVVF
jgi:hypothetical protein